MFGKGCTLYSEDKSHAWNNKCLFVIDSYAFAVRLTKVELIVRTAGLVLCCIASGLQLIWMIVQSRHEDDNLQIVTAA